MMGCDLVQVKTFFFFLNSIFNASETKFKRKKKYTETLIVTWHCTSLTSYKTTKEKMNVEHFNTYK